ncbi:hypothetical protein [Nocardiopsis synnemataformans]|uniref:hypothetical protein n=1 Tax=Nocardiopsis synnemataformans TaxID=61305 RepID=UPI003EB6B004
MRFGTHPIQIAHEWNTAVHLQENESDPAKRAFTHAELVTFFDHADDQVDRIPGHGRKGWLPAFRDATLFKTAYAFGLRCNETRMLDLVDFSRNPHAPAFGDFGVCQVRHGKAKKGSPPKRRSVLTVSPRHGTGGMDRIADVLQQGTHEVRPALRRLARALHLRLLRLSHPHPAQGPGPDRPPAPPSTALGRSAAPGGRGRGVGPAGPGWSWCWRCFSPNPSAGSVS